MQSSVGARGAPQGAKATILVVDDEEAVQRLLTFPLEREGYRVVTAGDGEEALDKAGAERPDLILLDVMLPGIDGLEVCRRVRATSSVPIIMLTARDDEIDKVLGLELGADDYITKPFSLAEVRSRIRAVLRRAQLPPPAADEVDRVLGLELGADDYLTKPFAPAELVADRGEAVLTRGLLDHPEAVAAQVQVHEVGDVRLVLDDQDRALVHVVMLPCVPRADCDADVMDS